MNDMLTKMILRNVNETPVNGRIQDKLDTRWKFIKNLCYCIFQVK